MGKVLAQALARLLSNLKNPRWYGAEAVTAGTSIFVIAPTGRAVKAWLKGHFHHDNGHFGDHFADEDDNHYVTMGGKTYYYNAADDTFYNSTVR